MNYGEVSPILGEMARSLRLIAKSQCGNNSPSITSTGTGNVPAGFNSISIMATSVPTTVTFSDGSIYTFDVVGESIVQQAADGGSLPAYTLSSGTIKWIGTK